MRLREVVADHVAVDDKYDLLLSISESEHWFLFVMEPRANHQN